MSSKIKNILVIGAGGNVGTTILKELIASPFNVTVLSRLESRSTFPADIKVIKSDYSPESLESAFTGQDAVVSLVAQTHDALSEQQKFVDAAIAAGVKRFFPSEYGANTSIQEVLEFVLPVLKVKHDLVEYLISKESQICWTAVPTSAFFDWGHTVGFLGFDLPNKKASIWDGGDIPFSATNLSDIGKAIVACLLDKSYEKTKNQYVCIASFQSITQNEILASFEKATGVRREISTVDGGAKHKEAIDQLEKGDFSGAVALLQSSFLSKVALGRFDKVWNDELGLPKEDLDEVVRDVLDGKRP